MDALIAVSLAGDGPEVGKGGRNERLLQSDTQESIADNCPRNLSFSLGRAHGQALPTALDHDAFGRGEDLVSLGYGLISCNSSHFFNPDNCLYWMP